MTDGQEDPVAIGSSLDRLLNGMHGPGRAVLRVVFGSWEEAVGPAVAEHARPAALRQGTLVVAVDHPAWATQLRLMGPDLLARLERLAGTPVADQVQVRVVPPRGR
ncbi:MAG: DciA family protein [Acidimicrobiales bacterium]